MERAHNERLASLLKDFVDDGEAEAIVLALEVNADLLLVDYRDARNLAKKLGLQVIGTLGILALAKYNRVLLKVKPVIEELVKKGFWISGRIIDEFLEG